MVRVANNGGDGSMVWPRGCTSIEDVPWDLLEAIKHAHIVLGWQEHLTKEEMPPEWMWPFSDEVGEWMDNVWYARRNHQDFESPHQEAASMDSNEFADRFKNR